MKRLILTRDQIYEKERQAYEKFCIPPLILMESAGRAVALEVQRVLKANKKNRVVVISGPGNNGGDGMVTARYLHCWGFSVVTFTIFDPGQAKEPAFTNYKILVKMNLVLNEFTDDIFFCELRKTGLIVDAIFGIGLSREIRGRARQIIEAINNAGKYVISADIPSGIDADTGETYGVAVKADRTITFGFGKKGLYTEQGRNYAGKIKIVDIGFPPELYD